MDLKGLADATKVSYSREVRRFFNRQGSVLNPESVTEHDFRKYFLHLSKEKNYSVSALKAAYCGNYFFFNKTLHREWSSFDLIKNIKSPKTIPTVLSRSEVLDILYRVRLPQGFAYLYTLYSCGLRGTECLNLKVNDIDSKRMKLIVRKGKGKKDREVPLSEFTLKVLRRYWSIHKNPKLIFPALGRGHNLGPASRVPMALDSAQGILRSVLKEMNFHKKKVTLHTFRHSYATHMLEAGVNLRQLQLFLGHSRLETTTVYLHLTQLGLEKARVIINNLMTGAKQWEK